MGDKKKIKFQKYTVKVGGHTYDVLIPPNTDRMWISGYGDRWYGTTYVGDRKGLEALLYSATVLGFNPVNKLVYFPLRENDRPRCYKIKNEFPGERDTIIEDYDLIFTTHQAQFKRSDWGKIKEMLPYMKAETYILNYDAERTCQYFEKSCKKCEKSSDVRKEYEIETLLRHTVFHVFSRRMFQELYLSWEDFLRGKLEQEYLEYEIRPWTFLSYLGGVDFSYRKRLYMQYRLECAFYDESLEEERAKRWEKEKKWGMG